MKLTITLISYFLFLQSYSQTNTFSNNQEKIKNYIETYFKYDRENIHVQFNKDVFVNNEQIVFKGYVFNKNKGIPNVFTSNIQLVIYDEQDQVIQKQLLFADKGSFDGGFQLDKTMKSGRYRFLFYTNWMNNFEEDNSYTQIVQIIDKDEPYDMNANEPLWKTAKVNFFPEGGDIVSDLNNAIGVKITDCNNLGIEIKDALILDSKSNEIARFSTNKMGNGIFYIYPNNTEKYTISIKNKEINLSFPLPSTKQTGITLSFNNNLPKDIFAVAIKTNEKGFELYKNKKFIILIHQDLKSIQKEFSFDNDEMEKVLFFDKKYLSNGVNSIRLIDENLNEITERLLYHYGADKKPAVLDAKYQENDSVQLRGKTDLKNANLSISVLPKDNSCLKQKKSILGTFYLNTYLEKPETNNYSYFDLDNKARKQDMEALMATQKRSKTLWENIKNKTPDIKYNYNKGVTISGKVEKDVSKSTKNKITLINLKNSLFEEATIDLNGNFKFENFFAQDSTVFLLQMINEKGLIKNTKIETKVSSHDFQLLKPFPLDKIVCPIEKKTENIFTFNKPNLEKSIIDLAAVTVINNAKKEVLIHENAAGIMATGYKITDTDYGTVLEFLSRHGFRTGLNANDNSVYIRSNRDSFSTDPPPVVFLDSNQLFDYNLLFSLDLSEVDEIYIDKTGSSSVSANAGSSIQIFLKQGANQQFFKTNYTSLIVTTGFSKKFEFINTEFDNQKEFFYFGTLNWTADVLPKEDSSFEIKFPRGGQNDIQVQIEGFSQDGELISEIKSIPIRYNN